MPHPDQPGPRWATGDGTLYLADATWGHFDRDEGWEAVIRLVENTGGTAYDGFLAVVRERAGRLVNGPLYYLGDRTTLLGLRAADGVVTADLVQRGEDDPRCCPTDTVEVQLGIRGDSLVELDAPLDWRLSVGRPGAVVRARADLRGSGGRAPGRRRAGSI